MPLLPLVLQTFLLIFILTYYVSTLSYFHDDVCPILMYPQIQFLAFPINLDTIFFPLTRTQGCLSLLTGSRQKLNPEPVRFIVLVTC